MRDSGRRSFSEDTAPSRQGMSADNDVRSHLLLASDLHGLNDDILDRTILGASPRAANLPDDVHAVNDFAEDAVAVVEVRCRPERNEELTAIGVGTAIGHRQNAGLAVTQRWMKLVSEIVPGSTRTSAERIAALDHESVDDAV